MNGTRTGRSRACLAVLLLAVAGLLLPPVSLAEVGVDRATGAFLSMALETGDEGPSGSPFPWGCVRPGASTLLNEHGDDEGDGAPSIAFAPGTARPVVAWAESTGDGWHRVVLSRWNGSSWSEPAPVSQAGVDAADASVAVSPAGLPVVAWWEPTTGTLTWVRRKLVDGTWDDPESIGGGSEPHRFPSVAALEEGDVAVAFTVEVGEDTFEVRVARRSEGWAERTIETGIAESQWRGRGDLAVEIHHEAGVTWMEWARTASEFATSRLDPATGEWSAPESIPCEATRDGWRRARFEARRRALGW